MASAVQWAGPTATQPAGNWTVTTNWNTGILPGPTDGTTKINTSNGANIVVTTAVTAGVKPQITSTAVVGSLVKLEIKGSGSITNSGSFDGYTGSMDGVIRQGGVWNSCTTGGSFKMAANTTVQANSVTLNVYGALNVKGTSGTATLGMVNDSRSGSSGVNSATLNIYGGGLVNVDAYTIGTYGVGRINIASYGTMKIKGNVLTQVNADITAGKITGIGGATPYAWYQSSTNATYVPEPATVALLGLGSLMLLRRKR